MGGIAFSLHIGREYAHNKEIVQREEINQRKGLAWRKPFHCSQKLLTEKKPLIYPQILSEILNTHTTQCSCNDF